MSSDEFKVSLISHAKLVVERSDRAHTEAATQQYLVLPFFKLLGYDPLNPDEIIPEAHASFSDKFRNRVDYAICINGHPAIAVECKCVGRLVEANRGELKGYFNAVPTVKLGVLTDGLVFELYSDTGRENMMDDDPFVRIDFQEAAEGRITENALDALVKLRKGTFDPADVGADAKRKIYIAGYVEALEESFREPSEVLTRALMDIAGVDGRRTARLVEEHTPIVSEAIAAFFDKKLLERVGFADRQDLVRVPVPAAPVEVAPAEPESVPENIGRDGIITTERELWVFGYVRTRLSFLIDDENLFERLDNIRYIDRKTLFTVFYRQERKGRLLTLREGPKDELRFSFADGEIVVTPDRMAELDKPLLSAFKQVVTELG